MPKVTTTKTTPSGHRYGIRKFLFRAIYIPKLSDSDVIQYLLTAREQGKNITQLITDAIRLYMGRFPNS